MQAASRAGGVEAVAFPSRGLVADPIDEQFEVGDSIVVPGVVLQFGRVQFRGRDGAVPRLGVAGLFAAALGAGVPVPEQGGDS